MCLVSKIQACAFNFDLNSQRLRVFTLSLEFIICLCVCSFTTYEKFYKKNSFNFILIQLKSQKQHELPILFCVTFLKIGIHFTMKQ